MTFVHPVDNMQLGDKLTVLQLMLLWQKHLQIIMVATINPKRLSFTLRRGVITFTLHGGKIFTLHKKEQNLMVMKIRGQLVMPLINL